MAQPLSIPRDVRSASTELTEFPESLGHVPNLAQHMSSEDSFSDALIRESFHAFGQFGELIALCVTLCFALVGPLIESLLVFHAG